MSARRNAVLGLGVALVLAGCRPRTHGFDSARTEPNTLDGTVQEEKIYHMAGAVTPESMTPVEIERLIRAAGREPVK